MLTVTILPDFQKLGHYFPRLQNSEIAILESSEGIEINLEYFSQKSFTKLSEGLKTCLSKNDISEHFNNILYITVNKVEENERIFERMLQEHGHKNASSELADFLLTFIDSKPNVPIQITTKSPTRTSYTKNAPLARWMFNVLHNAIENKDFPMDETGISILKDFYGDDPFSTEPISEQRLRKVVKVKVNKPTDIPLQTELCLHLRHYLIEHTPLKPADGKMLTDQIANLLFDVLELLGYVNREKVAVPKDFIYARLANYISS